ERDDRAQADAERRGRRGLRARRRLAGVPFPPVRTRAGLLLGILASAAAVAAVSALVWLLKPHVPGASLGALSVLAVLPLAIAWGTAPAAVVSVASMLAFNWFFLPPVHSFHLQESENWLALAVYLVIAFAVGALAARARTRRKDAEQRRVEAH